MEVESFNVKTDVLKKKFNKLVSDFDNRIVLSEKKDKINQDILIMFKDELLNQARIVSTLVELDFIQQSLDF